MSENQAQENMVQTNKILNECSSCNICVEECLFLEKHSTTPIDIALAYSDSQRRDGSQLSPPTISFSCFLCGLCDSFCPLLLSPRSMFKELRQNTIKKSAPFPSGTLGIVGGSSGSEGADIPSLVLSKCKPFLTDKKYNLYSLYRSANSIDYSDLQKSKAKTILFPGCTLGTFHPRLTRALFDNLVQSEPDLSLVMDCCYKPLDDLGLEERFDKATGRLKEALDGMGVEKIIVACPSCLQQLGETLKGREVVSCYTLLRPTSDSFPPGEGNASEGTITVHDSCSDRETGVVGSQVRGILTGMRGVKLTEMEHNGRHSLCCGSGGLVSAFDPKLAIEASSQRLKEAERTGSHTIVTYCATCSGMLQSTSLANLEVRHALELLLGIREDYQSVSKNVERLFVSGPRSDLFKKLIENSP